MIFRYLYLLRFSRFIRNNPMFIQNMSISININQRRILMIKAAPLQKPCRNVAEILQKYLAYQIESKRFDCSLSIAIFIKY